MSRCVLFDWGDTLMRDFPEYPGPMASWPVVESLPRAAEVLAALRSGWTLALATNAGDSDEAAIRAALARVGLDALLDRIYCRRTVGHEKPAAEFFEFILEDLRLDRSAIVMVGDDFDRDVLGANRAGIRAIWLNERSEQDATGRMHRTVHRLDELPGMLARWESR